MKRKENSVHDRNDTEFLKVHAKELASDNDARWEIRKEMNMAYKITETSMYSKIMSCKSSWPKSHV